MDGETKKSGRGRGRGRGRGARGRGRGRGRGKAPSTRGRSKKMVIESDEEEQIETSEIVDNQVDISDEGEDHNDDDNMVIDEREKPEEKLEEKLEEIKIEKVPEFNIDDDISQLVPPTFSTVSKGPPQPMLELSWDHKYTSLGDKLPSPNVHMCIGCKLPIRIYGRLISCKHVFCYACAIKQGDYCSCCSERVFRVEKVRIGLVYMCLHGGKPYRFDGCRRTYLSQRDLQAHVNHRHKPRNSGGNDHSSLNSPGGNSSHSHGSSSYNDHGGSSSSHYSRQNIPVHYSSSSRSNLIAVPTHQAQLNASTRPHNPGEQSSTPGSRYERKPSFSRNASWGSYNNRQF